MPAEPEDLVYGRHPVREALRSGRSCHRLLVARGSHGPAIDELFALAREQRIPFVVEERQRLDQLAGLDHQGVVAVMAARTYAELDQLLNADSGRCGFLVFLDQIQDPHNLGAIVRTAHATGADGVVIQARGGAGLTGAAVKAAAGAADHLPVCRVTNMARALAEAKQQGYWVTGLDAGAPMPFHGVDLRGPTAVVVGSEGTGLRRLVREVCDHLVQIPMGRHEVGSLNASVAAGIVLYEVYRQRAGG